MQPHNASNSFLFVQHPQIGSAYVTEGSLNAHITESSMAEGKMTSLYFLHKLILGFCSATFASRLCHPLAKSHGAVKFKNELEVMLTIQF